MKASPESALPREPACARPPAHAIPGQGGSSGVLASGKRIAGDIRQADAAPRALTVGVVSPSGTRGLVGCCAAEVWASTRRCCSGGKGAEGGPPPPAHAPCARHERPPSDLQWAAGIPGVLATKQPHPIRCRSGVGLFVALRLCVRVRTWATFRRSLPRNARLRRNRARPPDPPIPLAHLGKGPGDCHTGTPCVVGPDAIDAPGTPATTTGQGSRPVAMRDHGPAAPGEPPRITRLPRSVACPRTGRRANRRRSRQRPATPGPLQVTGRARRTSRRPREERPGAAGTLPPG